MTGQSVGFNNVNILEQRLQYKICFRHQLTSTTVGSPLYKDGLRRSSRDETQNDESRQNVLHGYQILVIKYVGEELYRKRGKSITLYTNTVAIFKRLFFKLVILLYMIMWNLGKMSYGYPAESKRVANTEHNGTVMLQYTLWSRVLYKGDMW